MLRNIEIMKYYMSLSLPFMLGPILHVFYLSRGLNVSDYYVLFFVGLVSVFVFELPTGVVADKLGYKRSLIYGSIIVFISILLILFSKSLQQFIFAEIMFGFGVSFMSGADSALIYDSLLVLGREDEYSVIYSRTRQYMFVSAGIGSLISSMLYSIWDILPFMVNSAFVLITVYLAMQIKEPLHIKKDTDYKKQLKTVRKQIYSNKKIWAVILISSIVYMFYRPSFNLYQPYFLALELDVFYYGMIFFGLNIIALLSSKHSDIYYKITKGYPLIGLVFVLLGTYLLLSIPILAVGILGMGVNQIVRGLYKPVVTTYINELTSSDVRATTLSFVSLINNVAAGVGALILSLFVDNYIVFDFVLILALSLILMIILTYGFVYKKYGIK